MKTLYFIRYLTFFGFALLTFASAAQSTGSSTTSELSLGDWYNKLRESPLSLFYSAWIGSERNKNLAENPDKDPNAITGISTYHYIAMGLKLSPNDSLSLATAWYDAHAKGYSVDQTHFATDITYTRRGILTQKDHGINLSAGLRQRMYNTNYNNRNIKQTYYGDVSPRVSISRSLTDNLSFSSGISYQYFIRSSGTDGIRKDQWVVSPGLSYQLSPSWSVSLSTPVLLRNGKNGMGDKFTLDTSISLGYSINSIFSIAFGVSSGGTGAGGIMTAYDGRLFAKNLQDNVVYSISASISAF